jgi:chromosome condensin MukBEF complex kleisin-like MukF subunit
MAEVDCDKVKQNFKDSMSKLKFYKNDVFVIVEKYVKAEITAFVKNIHTKVVDKTNNITINIINKNKNNTSANLKSFQNGTKSLGDDKQKQLILLVNNFIKCEKADMIKLLKEKISKETNKNMKNILKNFNAEIKEKAGA